MPLVARENLISRWNFLNDGRRKKYLQKIFFLCGILARI